MHQTELCNSRERTVLMTEGMFVCACVCMYVHLCVCQLKLSPFHSMSSVLCSLPGHTELKCHVVLCVKYLNESRLLTR